MSYDKYPKNRYLFTVSFGCAPKNVDHLVELVEREIKRLREKGLVAEDIEKFKAESERQYEVQYATYEAWLGYIYGQLENREPLSLILSFKERLDKVNQASVQEAAKKYLSGQNEIKFELLPEK